MSTIIATISHTKSTREAVTTATDKTDAEIHAHIKLFAKHCGVKVKNKHLNDDTKICAMTGDWQHKSIVVEFEEVNP